MCPELIGKSFSNTRKIYHCIVWKSWRNSNKILNLGENQAEEVLVERTVQEDFIWR
jgi:hypothetical protein